MIWERHQRMYKVGYLNVIWNRLNISLLQCHFSLINQTILQVGIGFHIILQVARKCFTLTRWLDNNLRLKYLISDDDTRWNRRLIPFSQVLPLSSLQIFSLISKAGTNNSRLGHRLASRCYNHRLTNSFWCNECQRKGGFSKGSEPGYKRVETFRTDPI